MILNAIELQKVKILDLAEGHEFVGAINGRIKSILREMQMPMDNVAWKKLNDEGYELKKARRNIQTQMGRIAATRRQMK